MVGIFLRLAIFLGVITFLYLHLAGQKVSWSHIQVTIAHKPFYFLAAVVLMPVNWGLETAKWHYIISRSMPVSWKMAFRSVLSGLAFGLVTPRAVGDYAGRILALQQEQAIRFVGPLMISRLSQLMVTLFFGSFGVYLIFGWISSLITFMSGPLMLTGAIWLTKTWEFPGRKYVAVFLEGLSDLNGREIVVISLLSVLRYAIFFIQFCLVLQAFITISPVLMIGGVSWIFLAKSVIPGFNFLGDLGVREISAVFFFSFFGVDTVPVIFASLVVWCLNIAIPSLAGGLIVLKDRWS
jgi:uncharacterized membrane protein YbhN (UPF0104 family)